VGKPFVNEKQNEERYEERYNGTRNILFDYSRKEKEITFVSFFIFSVLAFFF
jgi:hypothetical protein